MDELGEMPPEQPRAAAVTLDELPSLVGAFSTDHVKFCAGQDGTPMIRMRHWNVGMLLRLLRIIGGEVGVIRNTRKPLWEFTVEGAPAIDAMVAVGPWLPPSHRLAIHDLLSAAGHPVPATLRQIILEWADYRRSRPGHLTLSARRSDD